MLKFKSSEIARLLEGELSGDGSLEINSIAPIEKAGIGDITFYYQEKYETYFKQSHASCIIISDNCPDFPKPGQAFIKVNNPYEKFVRLLKIIDSQKSKLKSGIHPSAIIGNDCEIADSVHIGANCVIGDNCKIGAGSVLRPAVILYENVTIGEDSVLNSNVTVYSDVIIGSNCIFHAGSVIGSDGFGYIESKIDGSYDKIPQLGNVVIEDNVEIGANTTIDKALAGTTKIGMGTKIDNLVQIGHNCVIGEHNGIASQVGISGSAVTGKRNRFGGQSGIAGHLEISDDVTILAQSGVSKTIPKSGVYFGSPIKEHFKAFKIEAVIRNLPELANDVAQIKKKINTIND